MTLTNADHHFLEQAVDLAEEALSAGDEPFGTLLVSANGEVLFEDHNRVSTGDHTQHPEFEVARWAAAHLRVEERSQCTVYTSGEHCPMCAAAHGWVSLGRIVYASSADQLGVWLAELGLKVGPVASLPIQTVVPGAVVDGPDPKLTERVRALHAQRVS